jgi:hypothetical protein
LNYDYYLLVEYDSGQLRRTIDLNSSIPYYDQLDGMDLDTGTLGLLLDNDTLVAIETTDGHYISKVWEDTIAPQDLADFIEEITQELEESFDYFVDIYFKGAFLHRTPVVGVGYSFDEWAGENLEEWVLLSAEDIDNFYFRLSEPNYEDFKGKDGLMQQTIESGDYRFVLFLQDNASESENETEEEKTVNT